jgi:phenylalanyl-tRNA synthetase beta chain
VAGGDIADYEKSLAVRLTFNSLDATLNEETIDAAVNAVVNQLKVQLGARQRV